MTRLARRDLEAVVAMLGDAATIDGPDPFTQELADRLAALFACEYATYERLDHVRRIEHAYVPTTGDPWQESGVRPDDWDREHRRSYALGVSKASDEYSWRARRAGGSAPVLSWLVEHGVVDTLSLHYGRSDSHDLIVHMDSKERDFDDRDRLLLEMLQPHFDALERQAETRRRFNALLSAMDRAEEHESRGLIVLGRDGRVDHASETARRLVGAWFGELDGRLPDALDEWRTSGSLVALVLRGGDRRLVVEAPNREALLVSEQPDLDRLLTARERDVMQCVAAGLTTAETARRLWVTPATVSKHLEHVYAKLGVRSRTAAVAALGLATNLD
jgi:DNA-binding CsgD family transcriptional regulator